MKLCDVNKHNMTAAWKTIYGFVDYQAQYSHNAPK